MGGLKIEATPMRRVRPLFAALLTFVALGLGFYYAGRARTAGWLATLSVVLNVLMAALVLLAILAFGLSWLPQADALDAGLVSLALRFAIAAPFAFWAFRATRTPARIVDRGPLRLFGYLMVWLAPILATMAIAMVVRTTLIQPFRTPSGSMAPTIAVGDYMFANKRAYGYGRFSFAPLPLSFRGRYYAAAPQRGDIVVFRPSGHEDKDFVKRIVALPGDTVQMVHGELVINGAPVIRRETGVREIAEGEGYRTKLHEFVETLPDGPTYTTWDRGETPGDDTQVYRVPRGACFVLGDDRDNSADSRLEMGGFGMVPFDNLVGRIDHIARRGASP